MMTLARKPPAPQLCRERLYGAPDRLQVELGRQRFVVDAGDGQVRETVLSSPA